MHFNYELVINVATHWLYMRIESVLRHDQEQRNIIMVIDEIIDRFQGLVGEGRGCRLKMSNFPISIKN